MFDVVIPLGPNDLENIDKQIACTRANIIGLRNIYIVTPYTEYKNKDCIVIDEAIFPFYDQIAVYHNKDKRNAWYLQQLIKLYAGFVIPGITERYLVIDADTYFLKPTQFINSENQCQYNFGREYHCHYFDHMQKLHPEFERVYELSGICHHMMFDCRVLKQLFEMVEKNAVLIEKNAVLIEKNAVLIEKNAGLTPFWVIFLEKVEPWLRHGHGSGASEYELYFNYVCKYHSDEIEVRELCWENVRTLDLTKDLDYISHHHFMRD